ncbi:TetR/AcrR family transcriptional regulator [Promicromonospora iranensis]|uniref:AcrR family transcriptional regulator n=1 Tax=Promicromonospora iranensis TaxID=1105144 RepID=A0ABU2CLT8_9MICO|nr:TetR/AcrR family transcriptional regulator [Promicromonospora iranensis]MDR7382305.1 AcrR family transcriptional regulator [Promicromonospora iranensis]
MGRRGEELKEHILWSAKDVFLELGFERTSMDVVAARASTSKRSLYTRFPSKDALFRAVFELARTMYLNRLKTPDTYSDDATEAVTVYCARFLQLLLREPALRTCRMGIAEAERLPDASSQYYDAIFRTSQERLASFLTERLEIPGPASGELATDLLGRSLHPRFFQALFGVEKPLPESSDEGSLYTDVDVDRIRGFVTTLLTTP